MNPPDHTKFPDPQRYATYIGHRSPSFKTHSDFGKAKNAVSASSYSSRQVRRANPKTGKAEYVKELTCDIWVYEWEPDTGWQMAHHYPSGTIVEDDPWHKTPQGKKQAGPSQKAVNAAIASIMGTAQNI